MFNEPVIYRMHLIIVLKVDIESSHLIKLIKDDFWVKIRRAQLCTRSLSVYNIEQQQRPNVVGNDPTAQQRENLAFV